MSLSVKQEYNQVYWYLMLHLDPSGIDKMLKYENEQRKSQNAPTFLSLIPFLFLEHAASEKRLSQETKAETAVTKPMVTTRSATTCTISCSSSHPRTR